MRSRDIGGWEGEEEGKGVGEGDRKVGGGRREELRYGQA